MSASALHIHLDPNINDSGYVCINITISNSNETPITLLNWSTPLDPHADILGVFEMNDETTNKAVQLPTLKISRRLAPFIDDLVEVPGAGCIETEVTMPRLALTENHVYSIQAKGIWHALWDGPIESVTSHHLDNLSLAETGEFKSDVGILFLD
ncbi:hypothetical protein BO70DRAFT_374477 [Aspergillus heteromorphus CBS 117.55]|uniref:Uncharacterized protein n=1 Tax=Aspergillus heteromorphus CBS 117.55 TaxID=1448321 RepID=A0A317V1N6_9EURO|nr:uncharacterized protein BO70DRAFT_374477 [Aspergillus heteromorphus CBS 117.55]PWY67906.1 hypothetical protein BO70DRAFT_374477 [Aspergillus heteromorphus CBS 117.55]